MATPCYWPAELALWIGQLSQMLDARLTGRLLTLFGGILFAQGRRTVASWLRAAGVGADFRLYYYLLGSLGRKTNWLAARLLPSPN